MTALCSALGRLAARLEPSCSTGTLMQPLLLLTLSLPLTSLTITAIVIMLFVVVIMFGTAVVFVVARHAPSPYPPPPPHTPLPDDWYVIAAKPDVYYFVYYLGNNDAWRGYGGATVYTREPSLPPEIVPELRAAAAAAGLDWDKFQLTDNTCGPHPPRRSALEVMYSTRTQGKHTYL